MTTTEIESKVIRCVTDALTTFEGEITSASRFTEDLNADSLDRVEILMEIEDEFDMNIPDNEAEKITTVGQAVEYVAGKVGAA